MPINGLDKMSTLWYDVYTILIRRRVMKGRNTYVLSARVPDALYERVKSLATKRGLTPNDWLKNIIIAAAKYKERNQSPQETTPTALTIIEKAQENPITTQTIPRKEVFDDREEV